MIAVSSYKPFESSHAVAANQIAAKNSWEDAFDCIVYFGKENPALASDKTIFVESEEFPKIKKMMEMCVTLGDWSCIINSDIVVDPKFRIVEEKLKAGRFQSALSFRFQMPMNQVIDYGMDIFCCTPPIWARAMIEIPDKFRIGHILWDTWMMGFLMNITNKQVADFTPAHVIFHPHHEDRHRPFSVEDHSKRDPKYRFLNKALFPTIQISI